MTILEFIDARLTEWETWAWAASRADLGGRPGRPPEHWRWERADGRVVVPDISCSDESLNGSAYLRSREHYSPFDLGSVLLRTNWAQHGTAGHIIRNDPAQVVMLAAAFRGLIDEAFRQAVFYDGEYGMGCSAEKIRAGECPDVTVNEMEALRIIAGAWREHPDWDEGWVPEAVKNLGG